MNIPFTRNGKLNDTYDTKDSSYIKEITGCKFSSNAGTFSIPSEPIEVTKEEAYKMMDAFLRSKLIFHFVGAIDPEYIGAFVNPVGVSVFNITDDIGDTLKFTIPIFTWKYGTSGPDIQILSIKFTAD